MGIEASLLPNCLKLTLLGEGGGLNDRQPVLMVKPDIR